MHYTNKEWGGEVLFTTTSNLRELYLIRESKKGCQYIE
jgi:hypothetical protein